MRYDVDSCAVVLSVDALCAMAHKSGHLDTRHPRRTVEPHKGALEAYRREIARADARIKTDEPIKNTTLYNGVFYTVEGVMDGIDTRDGRVCVDGVRMARPANGDFYSRLRCLAYFVCEARDLREVAIRVRIFDADAHSFADTCRTESRAELKRFYFSLLARIEPFAKLEILRREERIPSVRAIGFPYPDPREGQTELAEGCYRAIRKGRRLLAQAPTGVGKTMSTLYPAVKAMGEGHCERIFYLTARAAARREAYAAAGKLFEAGAKLCTVVLYAKEQMCLHEAGCRSGAVSHCNPQDCPYARGYYDRVDGAISELLSRQNGFPRSILLEVARRHRTCPYELSLDLSEWCEIIICDYNYVFDPAVYLRRYFDPEEGERGAYVFLVDEAHNLPDRARSMYSAQLSDKPFAEVYARVDADADRELESALGGWLMALRRLGKLCNENRNKNEDGTENGYYLNRAPLEKFNELTLELRRALDVFVRRSPTHPLAESVAELSSVLRRYTGLAELFDSHFLTTVEMLRDHITVQIFCLDPSGVLNTCMHRARATILFSATLTPLDYFADILGAGKEAELLELPSPYDPERLCVTVVPGVDARMEERARSYKKIANMIAATVSARAGNYMVYFPSYDYLERVLEVFSARYPKVNCIVQQRNMSPREREAFLARFEADEGKLRVGFCVLGGSFSEGVDLPGSRLIGALIVGVGIPGLSNERNILREHFENTRERGYDYAYTYPGMNRVLQAAGRVIRGEEDRGVVVLLDARYAQEPYLHLYPAHWQDMVSAGDAASLARRLQLFWQKDAKSAP